MSRRSRRILGLARGESGPGPSLQPPKASPPPPPTPPAAPLPLTITAAPAAPTPPAAPSSIIPYILRHTGSHLVSRDLRLTKLVVISPASSALLYYQTYGIYDCFLILERYFRSCGGLQQNGLFGANPQLETNRNCIFLDHPGPQNVWFSMLDNSTNIWELGLNFFVG